MWNFNSDKYLSRTGGGPALFTLLSWANEITATRLTRFNAQDFTLNGCFKHPNIGLFAVRLKWVKKEEGKLSLVLKKREREMYQFCECTWQIFKSFNVTIMTPQCRHVKACEQKVSLISKQILAVKQNSQALIQQWMYFII